jgi:hypothetical protein
MTAGTFLQSVELASLNRQLEFASAELTRLQAASTKLQSEAADARASEQSQMLMLRDESVCHDTTAVS